MSFLVKIYENKLSTFFLGNPCVGQGPSSLARLGTRCPSARRSIGRHFKNGDCESSSS